MTDRSDSAIRADLDLTAVYEAGSISEWTDDLEDARDRLWHDVAPLLARAVAAEARAERAEGSLADIEKCLLFGPPFVDAVTSLITGHTCVGCACVRCENVRAGLTAELAEARARVAAVAKSCIATINSANYLAPMPLPAANATASIQAEYARGIMRIIGVAVCHHCGALPDADGDHSCPCPNSDEDCTDHPAAALAAASPPEEPK